MRTGIIGLPLVGKTSLFRILTHAHLDAKTAHAPVHIGVARVPDPRLDQLAALYKPRKVTHAAVEYVDVGGLAKDRARDSAYLAQLREVDALAHVVRVFDDPSVPLPSGRVDPLGDIQGVELELMLNDLEQAARRIERVERDLKKKKDAALEHELHLLARCRAALEKEQPLRELEFSPDERKILTSFMFLSWRPMLYVLNVGDTEAADIDRVAEAHNLAELAQRRGTALVGICGKIEAELAELDDAEAREMMAAYGLKESGLDRLLHATYRLLGLISFFTCGDAECRAWTVERGTTALKAAGAVHTDIERGFIKAEVVRWDHLLAAGSLAAARERGQVKLEGKEYVVEDGDVILFRHSG
jgi:hypothetical protein